MFNMNTLNMNTIEEIINIDTWKKMNPRLSITSKPFSKQPHDFDINRQDAEHCFNKLTKEGYLNTKPIIPATEVKLIAEAIEKIHSLGLPPIFIYLYDETWQIFRRLSKIVEPILDKDYKITIAGMWAWRIDDTGSGFAIHRDVYANDTREDGRPAHLTVWIPFTDATPNNSCMYMLPIHLDPNYPDNMQSKEITNYSDIRAVPAKAGSVVAWNANIAHWGSKSSEWAEHPRISIAMDFSRGDADMDADDLAYYASGPDLNISKSADLTFEQRLNTIGEAIWFYKNRVNSRHPEKASLLFEFCKSHSITSPEITLPEIAIPELTIENKQADTAAIDTPIKTPSTNNQSTDKPEEANSRLTPASKCVIRHCDGQGLAVYATEDIAANEIIEECHLVPLYQELIKDCSTKYHIESFNYSVSADHIEQVIALGFAGSYRHSSTANASWRQRKTKKTFEFVAERNIKAGEEIRINYAMGKSTIIELVPPQKLEVKESPGKGLGVFATQDIAEGEILEDCPVKSLGNELSATNVFSDYRFNYPKGVGSKLRVLTLGLGAVFNHSDNNNAYWINHPGIEQVFRFVATRDIKSGEEVCTSYGGSSYWDEQGVTPT